MTRLRRFFALLVGRSRFEREMTAEMTQHIELEIEDRIRSGMTPAEARRTALRDFGGVERWKEEARGARGLGSLDALRQDLRYAWRALRGAPSFALVAVLTLALGIGATTAVFSVLDTLVLRPLAYPESDRIVRLLGTAQGEVGFGTISYPDYLDWVERSSVFESAAAYDEYAPTLALEDRPLKVDAASVTASYFDVLGARPAAGRLFRPEDDEPGSARVVLSWGLWQEAYGGDAAVVGATIRLNGFPYTVVGVAAPMEDPGLSGGSMGAPRLWRSTPSYFATSGRGGHSFTAIARLGPGVTLSEARQALSGIQAALEVEYPVDDAGRGVRLVPLKEHLVGDVRPVLWMLMGAVALVLLIACANVANLLLFRSTARAREISLRSALGASRGRVVRQLLAESLLLAAAGGAGGVLVAVVARRGLVALGAGQIPRLGEVSLDPAVLGFAALAALGSAVLFGLVPALHATRRDLRQALAEGGRGSSDGRRRGRLRAGIVASQVGLAVVVMLGAGLLGRSLLRLRAVDPGLATSDALVLRIDPPFDPYDPGDPAGEAALLSLYSRLETRIAALPGVRAVTLTDLLPMSGNFNGNAFRIVGRPEPEPGEVPTAESRAVATGFFRALEVPVLEGRPFEPADEADEAGNVVVVSRTFARRWFPGGDAVGSAIRIFDRDAPPSRIVGVVGDVTQFTLDADPEPVVYVPFAQAPDYMQGEPWVIVRTSGDPGILAAPIRAAIAEVEPRAPVFSVRPLSAVVAGTMAAPRFRTLLLLAFAAVAFLLAAVGVYGMVGYSVARRLPELGVRIALGADSGRIRRLVVGQGLRPVLLGTGAGLLVGAAAVRVLARYLYGVPATDPITFIGTPLALGLVAALAAWLPARRAARTPPSRVLRAE